MASKASKKATPPQDASKKRSKPSVAKVNVNGLRAESPSADGAGSNSGEGGYLREIEKRVRSTSKKLTAMQKVISLVAEHPDTPIDELVSKNIINKDQREQYLKKPELEKQLAQLHEQREQFTKFEEDLKRQFDAEKQSLRDKFEADLGAARADTSRDRDNYLILSKFLCAAASRRNEADENEPETQAFEGLLLAFYNGNVESVDAMHKLVAASEDIVPSTNGEATGVTYARVKELSAPHGYEPETQANGVTAETASDQDIAAKLEGATISDPTLTHAGLTETEDPAQTGAAVSEAVQAGGPEVTAVDEGAANAAAADQWDEGKTANVADSMGESWVAVPRDASEVESQATGSAAGGQTQAWADEPMPVAPAPAIAAEPAAAANDGFHEVHHNRGGRRGGGGPRGGRGGGHGRGRGDGFRGRGRGGESRGGRGRGGRGRGD